MPECRQLICDQPAEFEVTVRYFGGVRERQALYCTEHLARVQEALATRETSEITNIRPLRGTTMGKKDGDFQATITRQQEEITRQQEEITRQAETINTLEHRLKNLQHEVSQYKAGEAHLKDENARLNRRLGAATTNLAHLVHLLHILANTFEADGSMVYVDTIDERLEELGLASRKKHFEMVFTVPVRLRVEGDFTSKEAMQTAFEAGSIDWNVADYEETLDDNLQVIEIAEMKQ